MSSKDWEFRISDILKSIDKIATYVEGMTFAEFKKNELVVDAVIRNLEIIGEASKNIPLAFRRAHPDIPWNQMNGMRNILIHEYFGVDIKIVWHSVKKYLPELNKQLITLLKNIKNQ